MPDSIAIPASATLSSGGSTGSPTADAIRDAQQRIRRLLLLLNVDPTAAQRRALAKIPSRDHAALKRLIRLAGSERKKLEDLYAKNGPAKGSFEPTPDVRNFYEADGGPPDSPPLAAEGEPAGNDPGWGVALLVGALLWILIRK